MGQGRFSMRVRATCMLFLTSLMPFQSGCRHTLIGPEGNATSCSHSSMTSQSPHLCTGALNPLKSVTRKSWNFYIYTYIYKTFGVGGVQGRHNPTSWGNNGVIIAITFNKNSCAPQPSAVAHDAGRSAVCVWGSAVWPPVNRGYVRHLKCFLPPEYHKTLL